MIKNIKSIASPSRPPMQYSYIIPFLLRASLFFLTAVTFLFTSCSPKKLNSLEIYFQKIERLAVQDSVISYNPKIEEKQVQFLWARAREFNFPYGANGVLHILEETRIKDGKQARFLIILLTKNKNIGARRIDYKFKDTLYDKQPFQKILDNIEWRSLKTGCSLVEKEKCEIHREWIGVAITPELRAILKKVDRHTTYRIYGKNIYYDFDAKIRLVYLQRYLSE